MRRFALMLVMAALLLGLPQQAWAQSGIEETDVGVFDDFGQHVTFEARIQSPVPIFDAYVVFSDNFDDALRRFPMEVGEDGIVTYRYDVVQNVLRPFVTITFWFEVTLQDGKTYESPIYHVQYMDDRFTWNQRTDGQLRVHWYEGDAAFGDALMGAANRSLNTVGALIPAPTDAPPWMCTCTHPPRICRARCSWAAKAGRLDTPTRNWVWSCWWLRRGLNRSLTWKHSSRTNWRM